MLSFSGARKGPASESGGDERQIWDAFAQPDRHISSTALDWLVCLLVFPYVLPAIGLICIAVKLQDPKNKVFFTQTRYGLRGRPFKIIKFRTMVPEAERRKAEFLHLSEDKGPGYKVKDDPRVTRFGRVLRKTHMDELPQFFNVIKGDMAVVGPRANSFHPSEYEPWQLERLSVKPGITGTWQVSNDKSYDFTQRCRMDIEYIKTRTLWSDLKIIFKTSIFILRAPGY